MSIEGPTENEVPNGEVGGEFPSEEASEALHQIGLLEDGKEATVSMDELMAMIDKVVQTMDPAFRTSLNDLTHNRENLDRYINRAIIQKVTRAHQAKREAGE